MLRAKKSGKSDFGAALNAKGIVLCGEVLRDQGTVISIGSRSMNGLNFQQRESRKWLCALLGNRSTGNSTPGTGNRVRMSSSGAGMLCV